MHLLLDHLGRFAHEFAPYLVQALPGPLANLIVPPLVRRVSRRR